VKEHNMNQTLTPLRYPGGKGKMTRFIVNTLELNGLSNIIYVEPFAGGAAVALNLLQTEKAEKILINDKDISIFSFWYSLIYKTDRFIKKINEIDISINEWKKQKEIQRNKEKADIFDLGFSTFFLNRTNHSGILSAGPIGGYSQNGKYKIDARFKKERLIEKIKKISTFKEKIEIFNLDVFDFIKEIEKKYNNNIFFFFDPPYYKKGKDLYLNFFNHENHVNLEKEITHLKFPWILSYDDTNEIREIYKNHKIYSYSLKYSLYKSRTGNEILCLSKGLKYPSSPKSSIFP